jgi:hypothetical protein
MDQIIEFVKKYSASLTPTNELELRMGKFDTHRFNSSISLSQFNEIKSKLHNPTVVNINDTNFQNLPYRQRKINNGKSVWIKKEKIDVLDIPEFDMRISLVDEICSTYLDIIKYFKISNPDDFFGPYNVSLLRKKKRYSESINGWMVDLTIVKNMTFISGNWVLSEELYEFELELMYKDNYNIDSSVISRFFEKNTYYNLTKSHIFIGNYPATLEKKDLRTIHTGYTLTDKVDGTRMFLIINNGTVELMGKNMIKQYVCKEKHITGCLLDGEYMPETKEFLAFDLLYFKGENCCERNLEQRHVLLDKVITGLDLEFIKAKKFYYSTKPLISISFVEYTEDLFKTAKKIWIDKNLNYNLDGLIFTPINSAYNKYMKTFKWKEIVTIDVLVRVYDGKAHMYGKDRQRIVPISQTVDLPYLTDNKIYEFRKYNGKWLLDRERPDKQYPNSILTIKSAMKAIQQNISIDNLST